MAANYATFLLRDLKELDEKLSLYKSLATSANLELHDFNDYIDQLENEVLWRQTALASQIQDGCYPTP